MQRFNTPVRSLSRGKTIRLWQMVIPLLFVANLSYLIHAWFITLPVFMLLPGYLLMRRIKRTALSRWETLVLSMGLSVLFLMAVGLLLSMLHPVGFEHPLATLPIFTTLDVVVASLLWPLRHQIVKVRIPRSDISREELAFGAVLTLMPFVAIGGAVRLNNGASGVLTMVLFGLVPFMLMLLLWRKGLSRLYPYAVLMMGLSLLIATSLRGWFLAGHDIHHEFIVFQQTSLAGYWSAALSQGDPYNACLSITVLPTILEQITSIPAVYIFKAVFQLVFALGIVAVYFVAKRISGSARKALLASFVFIAFPTFLSDLPFLNRQEIAFVYFALLILVAFTSISRRAKTMLTFALLGGLIVSHYSSSYVMVGLFVVGWVVYHMLDKIQASGQKAAIPLLSVPVLLVSLLATFLWNAQVTATTGGLIKTVSTTIQDLFDRESSVKDGFTQYSIVGSAPQSPQERFDKHIDGRAPQAKYIEAEVAPLTAVGEKVNSVVDVRHFNEFVHSSVARIFQALIVAGIAIMYFKQRKARSQEYTYFYALGVGSLALLVLVTLLPQISVDYSVIRLLQQALIVLALPIIVASLWMAKIFGRFRLYAVCIFFGFIFLHLSGFSPQITGGFRPQLALNNAGAYYDFFYTHKSDRIATSWMGANLEKGRIVYVDTNAALPNVNYRLWLGLIGDVDQPGNGTGYLYHDNFNTTNKAYRLFLSGDLVRYSDPDPTSQRSLLYANQGSEIYAPR